MISSRTFPAGNLRRITPSATPFADDERPRSIYIDTGGTIDYTNDAGDEVEGLNVLAGSILPFQPRAVTAATGAVVYGFFD